MLVYTDSTGKENWATWLRTFLCLRDFSHARLHQGTGDTGRVISDLKAKLIEMSAHTWQENLHSSNRSDVHTNYKKKTKKNHVIMTETYLGVLGQKYERDVYCCFRLGITELLCHENR